jgi:hypothetical protein
MNDKLNLQLFGWIIGVAIMTAWLLMPLWLSR